MLTDAQKIQVCEELCESHPEIAAGEDWRGYFVDWDEIINAAAAGEVPVYDESPIELICHLHNEIERLRAENERLHTVIVRAKRVAALSADNERGENTETKNAD